MQVHSGCDLTKPVCLNVDLANSVLESAERVLDGPSLYRRSVELAIRSPLHCLEHRLPHASPTPRLARAADLELNRFDRRSLRRELFPCLLIILSFRHSLTSAERTSKNVSYG